VSIIGKFFSILLRAGYTQCFLVCPSLKRIKVAIRRRKCGTALKKGNEFPHTKQI
jgi:hypothetical protein